MHMGLFDSVKPMTLISPVTGTAVLSSAIIDTQGYNGVEFLFQVGALASATSTPIVISQSDASNMAGGTAIGTTTAGTTPTTFYGHSIWRPTGRYLQAVASPNGTAALAAAAFLYHHSGSTSPAGTAGTATGYTRTQVN